MQCPVPQLLPSHVMSICPSGGGLWGVPSVTRPCTYFWAHSLGENIGYGQMIRNAKPKWKQHRYSCTRDFGANPYFFRTCSSEPSLNQSQPRIQAFSLKYRTAKPATSAMTNEDCCLTSGSKAFFDRCLGKVQVPSIGSTSCSIPSPSIIIQQNPDKHTQPVTPFHWHNRGQKATPFQTGSQTHSYVLP